jgi:hypothetical protein
MSIYSASVKVISRSAGRSATAAAAYRTGTEVIDERLGLIFDYTKRKGVDHVSMHLPSGCIEMDTHALWNAAEHYEKRKNSTVARELLVALPHELSRSQRHKLSASIAQALVEKYGVGAEVANHLPDSEGDGRNFHAHIMFTTRVVNMDGTFGAKTRILDDQKTGSNEVIWIRQMVEEKTNTALAEAGIDSRIDCRSLKDQRKAALEAGDQELANSLDRLPTIHEGPRVTQIRREAAKHNRQPLGALSRAAANDAIIGINKNRAELFIVSAQIFFFEKAKAARDKTLAWIEKGKTKLGNKKTSVERIEPRISNRDQENEAAFEKYGRQYFDEPIIDPCTQTLRKTVPVQQPGAKQDYVPSWKRRSIPDDDPSP